MTLALAGCSDSTKPVPPPPPKLPGPFNVTASPGPTYNAITVQWQSVAGATSYNLYWSTSPGLTPLNGTRISNVTSPYVHGGLTDATTYFYALTAVDGDGEGAASSTTQATTSGDIGLKTIQPSAGGLVDTQLTVMVQVVSRFQLATVVASVGGRSAGLHFVSDTTFPAGNPDGHGPAWTGAISLAGLARGLQTVSILATDVFANTAGGAVGFLYDQRPTLTVTAPDDFSVARPQIHVAVSCRDDNPTGCVSVSAAACLNPPPLMRNSSCAPFATAQSSIDQMASLQSTDGQPIFLVFTGTDSAGQTTLAWRPAFVEASTQLTSVDSVDGPIFDVQTNRILFVHVTGAGSALTIRDRTTRSDTVIFNRAPDYAYLTTVGAAFVGESVFNAPVLLYSWEHGVLDKLGNIDSPSSLVVKGDFAEWSSGFTLMRRQFSTGQNMTVSTNAGNWNNDVTPTGDVVYWAMNYQVVRFRGGVSTQLTADTLWSTYPVTDGVDVVYRKSTACCSNQQYQIAVYDTAEHVLTPLEPIERMPGRDYQPNNGWVAFTKSGAAGELQIWTRSPSGQERQVTLYGTSSQIEALGPNGEVVLDNTFGGLRRRYLAVPDYSTQPLDIGSAAMGAPFFMNGGLFIAIGHSLFQVSQ